ncbi:MAG: hypothetical protein AAGE92_07175 [Cyanobacteria bacterium P01_G01_bin.4]
MEPTEREIYLAGLAGSDEDVESLLAGGTDVDALIESGVLDAGEEGAVVTEEIEPEEETLESVDQTPMSQEEFQKIMAEDDVFLNRWPLKGALGLAARRLDSERESTNALSDSH